MELIINFDETPAYYDMIPHTTYEAAGVKQVNVKTANLHKKRVTCGLAITASGDQLDPILIFKGKEGSNFRGIKNHANFLLKKNSNGWMTEELMCDWITRKLVPYVIRTKEALKNNDARSLFVIDTFAGHFGKVEEICAANNIDLCYVPPGCTALAQPLDLTINRKNRK